MKCCSNIKCNQINPQPIENFYKKMHRKKEGLTSHCKTCIKEHHKNYFILNKDKLLFQSKQNYKNNKELYVSRSKINRQKNPNYNKFQNLKRKFNITKDEFNSLKEKQNNLCAVCKKQETAILNKKYKELAVDHCHKTKKIRGLLCSNCNTGLGKFKDNIELLITAINYLKENQ